MTRQYFIDAFNVEYLQALNNSSDPQLAAIAAKAIKESHYHLRRSRDWVIRLGDGTEESHQRMLDAIEPLWDYTPELFAMTATENYTAYRRNSG